MADNTPAIQQNRPPRLAKRLIIADEMKLRTKLPLALSLPFLGFFVFGVTDVGQRTLSGKLPPDVDHWKADDIYMGAGLAPWVYGLIPFLALFLFSLLSWLLERSKFRQGSE